MKFKLLALAAVFAFILPFSSLGGDSRENFEEAVRIVNSSGPLQQTTQIGAASALRVLVRFAAVNLWLDETQASKSNDVSWHMLAVPVAQSAGPGASVRFIMTW